MQVNKYSVIATFWISLLSFAFSLAFDFYKMDFALTISTGIFASGVLAFILSLIGYLIDRKNTLEKFYIYARKATDNFNRYETDIDLEDSIDLILQMNEFDYTELDNAYASISFLLFDKKKRDYIYNSIYSVINTLRELIYRKAFHFKEYRKAQRRSNKLRTGYTRVMQSFVDEVDKAIMYRTPNTSSIENVELEGIPFTENLIVHTLCKELTGKYWKIMYPFSKQEVPTNAD